MLIVCPSCASEYDVDPARLGPGGRKVRCASCRADWFAAPPPVALAGAPGHPDPAPVVEVRAVAVPRRRTDRAGTRGRRSATVRGKTSSAGKRLAVAAVLATLVAVPAAIATRAPLVAAVPRSASLFAAVGLDVNLVGLGLSDVSSRLAGEGEGRVLVVEGEIAGLRDGATTVPDLELTVEGEAGETLYQWSAKPPAPELARGESARFRARLASPPPAGRSVLVTFRDPGGRVAFASH